LTTPRCTPKIGKLALADGAQAVSFGKPALW
jgi:hypothetical protein